MKMKISKNYIRKLVYGAQTKKAWSVYWNCSPDEEIYSWAIRYSDFLLHNCKKNYVIETRRKDGQKIKIRCAFFGSERMQHQILSLAQNLYLKEREFETTNNFWDD